MPQISFNFSLLVCPEVMQAISSPCTIVGVFDHFHFSRNRVRGDFCTKLATDFVIPNLAFTDDDWMTVLIWHYCLQKRQYFCLVVNFHEKFLVLVVTNVEDVPPFFNGSGQPPNNLVANGATSEWRKISCHDCEIPFWMTAILGVWYKNHNLWTGLNAPKLKVT